MWENFLISLEIMGKGMLGIFAAILIIMLAVAIIRKVTEAIEDTKNNPQV